jgi:two-component system, chemotaxis family, sensor kinase CheA
VTTDPYRYFRIEAAELAEQLGQAVLELERSPPGGDTVARMLRLAHTLKGAARVVQQSDIANHAHAIEEVVGQYRQSDQTLSPEHGGHLLGLVDDINRHIAGLAAPSSTGPSPTEPSDAQAGPSAARDPDVTAIEPVASWRTDATDVEALLEAIGEAHAQFTSLWRAVGEIEGIRRDLDSVADHATSAPGRGAGTSHGGPSELRTRSIVKELAAVGRGLSQAVEHTERELQEVRASAERLRLVPAGAIFTALRRAVRDAAVLQDLRVDVECSGGDIRIDPYVLSAVYGAMLHAVRNSVAHGIEAEPDRRAAGKPAQGRVDLTVHRRGTRVVFGCRDDGRGFDLEAVRRAAQLTGLSPAQTAELDQQELLTLVLAGGITTTGTVTEVSGRGVGLDAVRAAADHLGGDVVVQTTPGVGTLVELEVPLVMMSIEALVVECADTSATIPIDSVRRSLRLAGTDIAHGMSGATVSYDERAIPFLHLTPILTGRPGAGGAPSTDAGPADPAVSVVVVTAEAGTAAIGIDRLFGREPVVVRALPELAPAADIVSGVSLDVEGRPRIALDPNELVVRAQQTIGAGPAEKVRRPERPHQTILVVDDSLTTRMLERSILEAAGYDVDLATSGEEALEKARQRPYALFLVDIEMPGMDGFTFVEHTREDPDLRDIPSVLVSSRASVEDRQRGVRAGARLHVAKSEFDQNELLRSIERLVA